MEGPGTPGSKTQGGEGGVGERHGLQWGQEFIFWRTLHPQCVFPTGSSFGGHDDKVRHPEALCSPDIPFLQPRTDPYVTFCLRDDAHFFQIYFFSSNFSLTKFDIAVINNRCETFHICTEKICYKIKLYNASSYHYNWAAETISKYFGKDGYETSAFQQWLSFRVGMFLYFPNFIQPVNF